MAGTPLRHAAIAILMVLGGAVSADAQLQGHGGPVRALAVSADGAIALSGGFDTSAIRWSLARNAADQVLRFHDGAVNAVAILDDGRLVTAGEDRRIALWLPGRQTPERVLEGHTAPIVSLAIAPDGASLASASWDGTVRIWSLDGAASRTLEGHQQNVNGVAFMPRGEAVVSAGYDATLRIWPLANSGPPRVITLSAPLNAVAVAPDGEIAAVGADGMLTFVSPDGEPRATLDAGSGPVVALAMSRDGEQLAAATIRGAVAVIDRKTRSIARVLVGPGLPVWSLAFLPDGLTLLTGGADHAIRHWNARTGEPIRASVLSPATDPLALYAGDPGAQVFRACVACHTLRPDEGNRAGPTLSGIFGRRIASLPGYRFSEALKGLDIIWTPETVAELFEVGPMRYTPGTKMPEQKIGPVDRAALIEFLKKATR